jgi:hypothetical protein
MVAVSPLLKLLRGGLGLSLTLVEQTDWQPAALVILITIVIGLFVSVPAVQVILVVF